MRTAASRKKRISKKFPSRKKTLSSKMGKTRSRKRVFVLKEKRNFPDRKTRNSVHAKLSPGWPGLSLGRNKKRLQKFGQTAARSIVSLLLILSFSLFSFAPSVFNILKTVFQEPLAPKTAYASYQFIPVSGTLVVGDEAIVTSATAAAVEGTNVGSWKGTLADDSFHWMATSTASGIDMQIVLGGAQLNGANKLIVQTDIDLDATVPQLLVQICDWADATSVDNAADAQCTTGGWRTLNTKNASQTAVAYTDTTAGGDILSWHIYNGYWSTGTTGGTAVATPLTNFVNGSSQIKIRYYSTTNTTSAVAVDYLRVYAVVDPIYQASGFTNLGSGTPAGTYHNTIVTGNTATAQLGQGGETIYLQVPGTAGSISDFYLSFGNIKTYTGMNTILVATDVSCSVATVDLQHTFAVYNFTTAQWEDISSPVDCSTADAVQIFAKNNVSSINDYISGGEVRIRAYGSINSATNLRIDTMYVFLGTTNTDAGASGGEISFGTQTAGRVLSNPSNPGSDQILAMSTDASSLYLAGFDSFGTDNRWRVEKRNQSDGALVTAFGTGGVVTSDPSTTADQILAIATTSDAIFLAGFDSIPGNNEWRVEKRDITTGALITAFDNDGVWILNPSAFQDRIYGLAVSTTSIYIMGEDRSQGTADAMWRVQKHDITTGATTTAFDTDGIWTYEPTNTVNDVPYAILMDGTEKLYIGGTASTSGSFAWNVQKLNGGDASYDTSFGQNGVWQFDPAVSLTDEIRTMTMDGTDLYLAGLDSIPGGATPQEWRIQKHSMATAATTTAFGSSGILRFNPGADNDWVTSLALDGTDLYAAGFQDDDTGYWNLNKYNLTTGASSTPIFNMDNTAISDDSGDDRANAVAVVGSNLFIAGYGTGPGNNQWIIEKRDASTGLLVSSTFGANTVAATRDIDTTATSTLNTWSIQSEDESSNMSHAYYALDAPANATRDESTAANITFSVTPPSGAAVTNTWFAGRFMMGTGGVVLGQLGVKDYSGFNALTGGWDLVGAVSTANTIGYTDPVVATAATAGYLGVGMSNPEDHIDSVGNQMNMRLRTTTAAATTTDFVTYWDFAMVSLQWTEDTLHPSETYQFVPTGSQLVTGDAAIIVSTAAAAIEGTNVGSWKGLLSDDALHWVATSTASGIDMNVTVGNVQLNGANKLIIQTEIDEDATTPQLLVQICDWVDATSVDNAADAQCTTGGWRTLNTKNASQTAVALAPTTGTAFQWHVYNGYWSTGTTGGTAVATPLTNFVNGSNQIKIRYYSVTNTTSAVAIDYLRVYAVVDPIYQAAGFTNLGSGTPSGTYHNTIVTGNTATAQQGQAGDTIHLIVPGTAGSIADFYLSFKNIKTYTGMNTILVATDSLCSAATVDLQYTFAVYNFTTAQWEDISSPVDCATTAYVSVFAKNNVSNINDYVSGGEARIRVYGSANSATSIQIDTMYVFLGTTNTDASSCEVSFGSSTAGRIFSNPSSPGSDQILAMSTDASSLYLAGFDSYGIDNRWRVEKRSQSAGALVPAFGTGGVVTSDPSTTADQILAIATTSDAIFLAGFDSIPGNNEWRVEKRDITTGALITAFDNDGVWMLNPSAFQDRIYGLAVSTTSIYIMGEDRSQGTADAMWRVQKHDITTGATTTAFDTDGIWTYEPSNTVNDIPYAILLDGNEQLYIGGTASTSGSFAWNVQKLNGGDASYDTTFGQSGIWQFDPAESAVSAATIDEIRTMTMDGTDLYLAGNDSIPGGATPQEWRIQKHNMATAATTTAFGSSGILKFNPGADNEWVTSLALDGTDLYAAGFLDDDAGSWYLNKYNLTTGASSSPLFDMDSTVVAEDGSDDRLNAVAVVGSNLFMGGYGSGLPSVTSQWLIEKRDASTGLLVSSGFGASTCADTRNIDTTATSTINFWNLQTEDELATFSHAYYPMDNDVDAVAEEAASANIPFSITAPPNAAITSNFFAGRYMAGPTGITIATNQLGIMDFSGATNVLGGWSAVGVANTVAMVYTDPVTVATVASGGVAGWMTNPEDHIDTVNNKMNLRLRTTVAAASTTNSVAMWDFAMASLQWTETATTTVQFSAASSNGAESVTPVTLTVNLSQSYGSNVTIDYAVTGGTATGGGTDYTLANGTLTFLPGQTSKTFDITVVDDSLDETNETIQVTLSNPTNASLGTNSVYTYTINDNDATPSLSINDVAVAETESAVSATFTITLSAASGQSVSVDLATSNGTATAGADYTATSSTFTIPAGSTSVQGTVTVLGDSLDEANETYNVNLSNAVNATISDNLGLGTINDNDATPSLIINDRSILEANDFNMYLVFTITLSAVSGRNVSVNLATSDGTATAGADYTATSSTFTILAGGTTVKATTTVLADTTAEANETFNADLSSAVNATIADNRGVGTIVDEDNASAQTASTTPPFDFGSGGNFTFRNQDNTAIAFSIPPNFYTENLRMRTQSFPNSFFTSSKPPPSGKNFVGKTYDFGFSTESGTEVTNTLAAVPITMAYADADVSSFTESTLKPYRWGSSESSWQEVSGSTLDTAANTVTFSTAAFSSFSLIGDPVSTAAAETASASTGGGGGLLSGAYDPPTSPAGGLAVLINGNARLTTSLNVTLNLRGGPNTVKMAISNFPDLRGAVLESYQPIKAWILNEGEGIKSVYVKFYTEYGHSVVVSNAIEYKTKEKLFAGVPPIVEQIQEFLKPLAPLIPEVLKLKPPEIKPVLPPVEEVVKKEVPLALSAKFDLLSQKAIGRFVFAPLPREIRNLSGKFPELGETFRRLGVNKITDIEKLKAADFTLPGLTQAVGLQSVGILPRGLVGPESISKIELEGGKFISPQGIRLAEVKAGKLISPQGIPLAEIKAGKFIPLQGFSLAELEAGKFISPQGIRLAEVKAGKLISPQGIPLAEIKAGKLLPPKGIPVAKLSKVVKQKLPPEIVFARSAGELIDYPISLKVTEKGRAEQKITTVVGNTLQLVVKPEGKMKRVRGYVVFKGRTTVPEPKSPPGSFLKPKEALAADFSDSYEIPLEAFMGSVIFQAPSLTNAFKLKEIENRLVLQEFEYSDPDGDGIYTAEIQAPLVDGEYEIITVMDYEDPRLTPKEIRLITVVDPEGYVYETDGDRETRIPGAVVSLYWLNPESKQYELWPAQQYQQENPQVTSVTGKYAFLAPEGNYYLKVEAPGYTVYDGKSFAVEEGRGVHFNIELKTKYWLLKSVDWKTMLFIVIILLLLYNFYRDKIRERITRRP